VTKPISAVQIAAIAWADPAIPNAQLAELLGVTFAQVRFTRERVKRDGIVCPVYWRTCVVCGGRIAAGRAHITRHRTCTKPAWVPKTPPDPDHQRTQIAAAIARRQHHQDETIATAQQRQARWTADDDARVIACRDLADLEATAIALQRTYIAVAERRGLLRRRQRNQTSDAPNESTS
jgi:hypothetical protein